MGSKLLWLLNSSVIDSRFSACICMWIHSSFMLTGFFPAVIEFVIVAAVQPMEGVIFPADLQIVLTISNCDS